MFSMSGACPRELVGTVCHGQTVHVAPPPVATAPNTRYVFSLAAH